MVLYEVLALLINFFFFLVEHLKKIKKAYCPTCRRFYHDILSHNRYNHARRNNTFGLIRNFFWFLIAHLLKIKDAFCPTCWKFHSDLRYHMQYAHRPEIYYCIRCSHVFAAKRDFINHQNQTIPCM